MMWQVDLVSRRIIPRGSPQVLDEERKSESGGVRPPSPPRHDTTAPEEPFARADVSAYLYFFILNF